MIYDSSRAGQKPVFLRGGKEKVNIEKHDKKQLDIPESWYQFLLDEHPDLLLAEKFDFEHTPISIGMEYQTTHGKYIDNLFITRDGKIIMVEDKLLKNESSRRVIAQAIDYAQDMQKWSYEDLENAFRMQKMNKDKLGLYDYVNLCSGGSVDQYDFVRSIEKNLQTASFLILIVGDKIHNDTEYMASFLNQHTTMNFQIGLIEIEVYVTDDGDWLVVPYLTSKTIIVEKRYLRIYDKEGNEDLIKEIQDSEKNVTTTIVNTKKSSDGIVDDSDEAVFSLIEQKESIEIREGFQEIIDDIRNNQVQGCFIKRGSKSFSIYLKNVKLVRPISIMYINDTGAHFDKGVFKAVFNNSNIKEERTQIILGSYLKYLENTLGFSEKKEFSNKSLEPLIENKVSFFTELRRLSKEIDEVLID